MILEFYFTLMNIKTFNKIYPKAFVPNISNTIHGIKQFGLLILSDMTKNTQKHIETLKYRNYM